MFHDQLANYYRFLGMDGFADKHEGRFKDEAKGYQKLCRYYVGHYNRLVPESELKNPEVIPLSWYRNTRQDVDTKTRLSGAIDGIGMWVQWEQGTKELFEQAAKELYNGGSVAASIVMDKMVADVDHELADAQTMALWADSLDLPTLMEAQNDKH